MANGHGQPGRTAAQLLRDWHEVGLRLPTLHLPRHPSSPPPLPLFDHLRAGCRLAKPLGLLQYGQYGYQRHLQMAAARLPAPRTHPPEPRIRQDAQHHHAVRLHHAGQPSPPRVYARPVCALLQLHLYLRFITAPPQSRLAAVQPQGGRQYHLSHLRRLRPALRQTGQKPLRQSLRTIRQGHSRIPRNDTPRRIAAQVGRPPLRRCHLQLRQLPARPLCRPVLRGRSQQRARLYRAHHRPGPLQIARQQIRLHRPDRRRQTGGKSRTARPHLRRPRCSRLP